MALDRVAGAGLGVDGAVGPAQPTAAEGFARVLGRDGLVRFPATQTALIVEMQEWFIANSLHGSAPDESTIRQRIKVIWRALKAE